MNKNMKSDGFKNSKFGLKGFLSIFLVLLLLTASCDENGNSGDSSSGGGGLGAGLEISDSTCYMDTNNEDIVRCYFINSTYPFSFEDLKTKAGTFDPDAWVWVEALGAEGYGGGSDSGTAQGGTGAYVRWLGTLEVFQDNISNDGLYILIGQKGVQGTDGTFNTSGTGGSSTVVIGKALSAISDVTDPGSEGVILIAAAGGGGGAWDNTVFPITSDAGGNATDAISTTDSDVSVAGGKGKGLYPGKGGNQDGDGDGGEGYIDNGDAEDGIGGISGKGGKNDAFIGWKGIELDWDPGMGGKGEDESKFGDNRWQGGTGGGGFGGGGGAGCCTTFTSRYGSGGAAGGSWVRQAATSGERDNSLGKDGMPETDRDGIVVITFDTLGKRNSTSLTIVEELASGNQSIRFTGSGFPDYCSDEFDEFFLTDGQSISCNDQGSTLVIEQNIPGGFDIGINCVGSSPWSVDPTTKRKLTVELELGDQMVCTFTNAETPDEPKTVFATSVQYDGQLDGLDGADDICNELAVNAGLDGFYRAWLSDSTESPSTRFIKSSFPYLLIDGTQIAEDWTDLTTCDEGAEGTDCLDHIIDLNEYGDQIDESGLNVAWTDTDSDGTLYDSRYSCNNWKSNSGNLTGALGYILSVETWTNIEIALGCKATFPLYCFEQ